MSREWRKNRKKSPTPTRCVWSEQPEEKKKKTPPATQASFLVVVLVHTRTHPHSHMSVSLYFSTMLHSQPIRNQNGGSQNVRGRGQSAAG